MFPEQLHSAPVKAVTLMIDHRSVILRAAPLVWFSDRTQSQTRFFDGLEHLY